MFWIQLLASLVIMAIGYVIMPKTKSSKSDSVTEMDAPTSEVGIAVPVIFGEPLIEAPNFLWYGEKYYQIVTSGGK